MFTANPIANHPQGHWRVVNGDVTWCEVATSARAWIVAAALNKYQEALEVKVTDDDGEIEP